MNIAIFPGTFSPVHVGHLMLAESAMKQFELDKVFFVLSPNPPNKLYSNEVISVTCRQKMLEAALQSNPLFQVDLRELKRSGPSYTIQTVQEIKKEFHCLDKLKIILGFDSFASLESWNEANQLKKECGFLVASRAGFEDVKLSKFFHDCDHQFIDFPPLAISSQLIRSRRAEGKSFRYLLPESVYEIYKNLNAD